MNRQERLEFRLFCENATDRQLDAIIEKEAEAAETFDDDYRAQCYEIACAERLRRLPRYGERY